MFREGVKDITHFILTHTKNIVNLLHRGKALTRQCITGLNNALGNGFANTISVRRSNIEIRIIFNMLHYLAMGGYQVKESEG